MATFGLTPITGFPPPTAEEFPNFIQFQEDGVNLGAPDADVVNFTGAVSATRGEGENANVITVNVVGGGGQSGSSAAVEPPLVVQLTGTLDVNVGTVSTWTGSVRVASTNVSYASDIFTFVNAGVYSVNVRYVIEPFSGIDWATRSKVAAYFDSYAGSSTRNALSRHFVPAVTTFQNMAMAFSEVCFIEAAASDTTPFTVGIEFPTKPTGIMAVYAYVIVSRCGDLPG